MLRKEKIKLLKQIAKGDSSGLYIFNKRYSVIFLGIYNDVLYYINDTEYFNNLENLELTDIRQQQIFDDPSIKKYSYNELKKLSERHYIFCMPMECFHRPEDEVREFYNTYLA